MTPHAPILSRHCLIATIQMVDVHLPAADDRHRDLPRHTRPNEERELLPHQLGMIFSLADGSLDATFSNIVSLASGTPHNDLSWEDVPW